MKKLLIWCLLLLMSILQGNDISNRQKFFRTVHKQPSAAANFLQDPDPEIRRYALFLVIENYPEKAALPIERALGDTYEQVRLTATAALAKKIDLHPQGMKLLQKIALQDKSQQIREIAVAATWPFHRQIKLLRNDPTWDYEVKVQKVIPLEKLPWRFITDPLQEGHLKNYFHPDADTSRWLPIKMGAWETQGFADYNGVAWYQIKFTMPKKIDSNAVEVHFDAVDESTWVWMNGVYLGKHDKGPEGWQEPFAMDCTKEIRWGKENTLTVRVYDAAYAGGIYKPLRIEILK